MSFGKVFVMACLIGPLFLFREMRLWQQAGYLLGASLWLLNTFSLESRALKLAATVILVVSCAEVVIEYFPLRSG